MSDPTKNAFVGELQGLTKMKRARAGLLAVTLGLTASVVASPTVKPVDANAAGASASKASKPHWFQIGKASWYGGRFNGKKTAAGETYDMNALTCAHRTLPLGSWIRVTNLRNRKSAFLRVNDRGPVSTNLIVDLSYAAAQRLGVSGLAKVRIDQVSPTDPGMVAEAVSHMPLLPSPLALGR
jgi:rare lipoprotein A